VLVIDASLAVELSLDRAGEEASGRIDAESQLVAPPLLWSEVPSVLHEMAFRGDISNALAELGLKKFLGGRLVSKSGGLTASPPTPGRLLRNSAGPRPTTPSTSPSPRRLAASWSRWMVGCAEEPTGSDSW
jgi:hypothetical protein